MTQELINTIKVHAWTKSELKELLTFCIAAMIDNYFIDDDIVNEVEE